jgi:hypothetical protein
MVVITDFQPQGDESPAKITLETGYEVCQTTTEYIPPA